MSEIRLGVYLDSFDPVCHDHLAAARSLLEESRLDLLLFIPIFVDGFREKEEHIWRMLAAACSVDKRFLPYRAGADFRDPAFLDRLISGLRKEYACKMVCCVIREEWMLLARSWHRPDNLAEIRILPAADTADSSSRIRSSLSSGRVPSALSPSVAEYITSLGLYGFPGHVPCADGWIPKLFSALNPHRFAHSLAVAVTARNLALRYRADPLLAEQAGLLHDCAKCLPLADMQQIARQDHLTDDPDFLSSGALLHSVVGARVARDAYGVGNPDILEAIAFHNTGAPGMSRLAMCVCLADYIEPNRRPFPLLEEVRSLSAVSLEQALLLSLKGTADHVLSGGNTLHPQTLETISWLQSLPACSPAVSSP